jgi:hypothetical protein
MIAGSRRSSSGSQGGLDGEPIGGDGALDHIQQRDAGVFANHEAILMALSSVVESNWKSFVHNTFSESALIGGIEDTPSWSVLHMSRMQRSSRRV